MCTDLKTTKAIMGQWRQEVEEFKVNGSYLVGTSLVPTELNKTT